MKLVILLLITSCSTPNLYRVTIGFSNNNTTYKSTTKEDDGDHSTRQLCIEELQNNVEDGTKCGEGYKEDKGISVIDPWIEFMPYYFSKSNFGFSYFLALNKSETTLLDYPVKGEKSDIKIDRITLNPIFYYSIGDKYITKAGGSSLRLGMGGALSYVYDFKITRSSNNEVYEENNPYKTGWAAFIEYNLSWFTFRVEHSSVLYESKKFDDVNSDELSIENNKASLYYSYYFR